MLNTRYEVITNKRPLQSIVASDVQYLANQNVISSEPYLFSASFDVLITTVLAMLNYSATCQNKIETSL